MTRREHHNWIGGELRAAAGARSFSRRHAPAAAEGEPVEHLWPESNDADVRAAIEAAGAAAWSWLERRRPWRWSALSELARGLASSVDVAAIGADLGLETAEYAPHASGHELALAETLELYRDGPAAGGVVAFGAHWSDGAAGLLARLAPRLLGGQTAVVCADARAPHAAQALVRALEGSAFARGVINIVHGRSSEARDALLGAAGLAGVRWKAPQEELERLTRRFAERVTPGWELWRCANSSRVVCERDNLEEAACSLTAAAFARAATLSGQHPGQVARVFCHQRRYSQLCEELRRRLASDADAQRPSPALDDDLERHVSASWTQGLDEGATAIFGGPGDGRSRDGAGGVGGIVFVNVDPAGALCRSSRPAPVLSLVRVRSDQEGRERRARLDLSPRWER